MFCINVYKANLSNLLMCRAVVYFLFQAKIMRINFQLTKTQFRKLKMESETNTNRPFKKIKIKIR